MRVVLWLEYSIEIIRTILFDHRFFFILFMVVVLIMVFVSHDILIHFHLLSTTNIGVINFAENQIWYKITRELLINCVIQYGYRMMSSFENSIWLDKKSRNLAQTIKIAIAIPLQYRHIGSFIRNTIRRSFHIFTKSIITKCTEKCLKLCLCIVYI